MRSILFLNDTKLIRLVLQDDVYLRVAGCLECTSEPDALAVCAQECVCVCFLRARACSTC